MSLHHFPFVVQPSGLNRFIAGVKKNATVVDLPKIEVLLKGGHIRERIRLRVPLVRLPPLARSLARDVGRSPVEQSRRVLRESRLQLPPRLLDLPYRLVPNACHGRASTEAWPDDPVHDVGAQ